MRHKATSSGSIRGPHPSKPTNDWQNAFLDHVRKTGQPETFRDLERTSPPEGSRPIILRRFDVAREKRPERDMAPCALCSPFHQKCLEGLYLVWYPDEGVVRVIGPECGDGLDGGELIKAERREFDRRQRQLRAEEFLEKNLPKISIWIGALNGLRPAVSEAQRLHHKLRSDNGAISKLFRQIRNKSGGVLFVNIEIDKSNNGDGGGERDKVRSERIGPKGFGKGPDAVDTYTEQYGILEGFTMFASDFEPIVTLDDLIEVVEALPRPATVEQAFDWICEFEGLELFEQIVERIREVQVGYQRLVEQLDSVIAFFDVSHFDRINRWGTHPEASVRLEASHLDGVYTIELGGRRARMKPNFNLLKLRSIWCNIEG